MKFSSVITGNYYLVPFVLFYLRVTDMVPNVVCHVSLV